MVENAPSVDLALQAGPLWATLSAALPGYVSCIDRQRRVLFLNRTLSRDLSDVLGQPIEDFIAPPNRDEVIARVEQAFTTNQEQRLEYVVVLGDGSRRHIATRVLPFRGAEGRELALMLTDDDTERRRLEQELERSVKFRRLVVEHLPDFVSLIDRDRRFVWANRFAPGLTEADVIGAKNEKFTTPETSALAEATVTAAFERGVSGQYEVEGYGDGRATAWYLVRVAPVIFAGRIDHVLLLTSDITERKRAEQGLREAEESLHRAQRLESIGQLAGGIAHDFNNLLQIIAGNLQSAQEGSAAGAPIHEELKQAARGTERAAELTSHLLAIGRRKSMDAKPVDLGALVTHCLRMLRRAIPENVELHFEAPTEPYFGEVDAPQFEQVLINLCINARDAMPNGGLLKVRLAPDGPSRVSLSVEDNGVGIAPESLPHIFEPFFSTKGTGSGLGLAVAAGIVGAHNGTMTVVSDARSGTRMKVSLPRVEAQGPSGAAPPMAQAPGRPGVILVAEDEPLVRAQLVRTLEGDGHTVLQAENGARAVALFREHRGQVDVLVLDAIMPVLDGWQTYLQISALEPGIKVLFATGYAVDVLTEDFAARGARLLSKPFKPAALRAEVRSLLSARLRASGSGQA